MDVNVSNEETHHLQDFLPSYEFNTKEPDNMDHVILTSDSIQWSNRGEHLPYVAPQIYARASGQSAAELMLMQCWEVVDYIKLSVRALQEKLRNRGIRHAGNKQELINRLKESDRGMADLLAASSHSTTAKLSQRDLNLHAPNSEDFNRHNIVLAESLANDINPNHIDNIEYNGKMYDLPTNNFNEDDDMII